MLSRSSRLASRIRSPASLRQYQQQQLRLLSAGGPSANTSGSTIPILAAGGGVLALFGYYFLHSDKSPGSGQATIKEARRKDGTSQERRDPRDSPVKTLEDKKRKEAGEHLDNRA